MISTVAASPGTGPLDRATLSAEWQQLAAGIAAEEAADAARPGGGGKEQPAAGKQRRTLWKK